MRWNLTRTLCAATIIIFAGGCKMSAKIKAGGEQPPPAPEPAPAPAPAPEPARAPAPKRVIKAGAIELPSPIVFESGSAKLKPESDAPLEVVYSYFEAKPEITKFRIEGHTDTDGGDAANVTLSQGRAMSVAKWLAAKGTDCKRMVPVGFGEERLLIKEEKTPEDKATNRRVMFIFAEVKGKPVMGQPLDGGGKPAGDACK